MTKKHKEILMCYKCYGLIKDELGVKYLEKNPDLKLCDCERPDRIRAIKIDRNIFGIIQALNLKGYYTGGCCEGYGKDGIKVAFKTLDKKIKVKPKGLPEGFVFTKTVLYSIINYKTQKQKREDEKKLLYWIRNSLEDIKNDNN